ncbi:tRNA(ile2) 2-agmatinylcytidine synthetase [Halogeometricum pallidum JCM 14848]|uniref:tRNA(Ile2) 2-agmatinylcytidine synthetase TiaS n=1 Tax=Halogeometricum pallidum JCM 14848 TaxID=1227487 RepID=M0D5U5_HALPD|nr:tRNA(Ile)(2)-agmatinylcytidine synthase [Halogeometricum pallidum]ELZ30042.1 tRNA(ile2) 2-agmatinylcytidine synthetase [Halogeometricum pallidum JCM 14848]
MTVLGLDDTDSRQLGMCTTYLATLVAEAIEAAGGTVGRRLLVRLNPAVEHKTRGNAALALHTDLPPDETLELAVAELEPLAQTADPRTSPGVVVAPGDAEAVPDSVASFTRRAIRSFVDTEEAVELAEATGYAHRGWDGGRGRIGALAAVGAWAALDEWTYEHIAYREFDRCGAPREVDFDSVFEAAEAHYPAAWDTVDTVEGQAVCVPNAPGPILHGIRGDDADAVRSLSAAIDSEPVERWSTFRTNQGTDVHLRDGELGSLDDGGAYRVDGAVASAPETRRGGHVFFELGPLDSDIDTDANVADAADAAASVACAAFEPTKRFRDRIRALWPGDELTVCGEVSGGTLKLEKFAVRSLNRTESRTPVCPDCDRTMESAGRNQGYRCRDCGTSAPGRVEVEVDRELERGWYEVPPCARRHVAKPLVRGGFDAPVHPER